MTDKIEWGHQPAGPWQWYGGRTEVYLASTHSGRLYAMSFHRRGMNGAQPTFRTSEGRMRKAEELATFEVGDRNVVGFKQADADASVYRYDIRGISNPIARAAREIPAMVQAIRKMDASWRVTFPKGPDAEYPDSIFQIGNEHRELWSAFCAILARIDAKD